MSLIAGTYELAETVNSGDLLKAVGRELTQQGLEGLKTKNSKLIVQVDGDNYVLTNTIGDAWKREIKFTLGKAFEEDVPGSGEKISTTATKEGNTLIFVSAAGKRTYEFTDSGATMILDGSDARRIYKRI